MSDQITIERFVSDCEYLGNIFEGGRLFYDYWLQKLSQINADGYSKYNEWISVGGVGTGKSTAAVVNLLLNACNLILDTNRHTTFGILPSTRFVFVIVNPKSSCRSLGGSPEWQMCKRMLEDSPFFANSYTISEKENMIDFKDAPVSIYSVSKQSEVLGFCVAGAIFSTSTVELPGKELDEEGFSQLYKSISLRLESRFMGNGRGEKIFPGCQTLISIYHPRDFITLVQERLNQAKRDHLPNTFITDSCIFEAKKNTWKYSGETFPVFLGSSPKILDSPDLNAAFSSRIIEVPIEYRDYFEKDIDMALRDIAGIRID